MALAADTMESMARSKPSPFESPLKSPRVRDAARELILAVAEDASRRKLSPKAYERALKEVARLGYELYVSKAEWKNGELVSGFPVWKSSVFLWIATTSSDD